MQCLGGDVKTNGNWTVSGTQTNNSKAVWFTGATGNQTVTKIGGGTVYFDYLLISKAAGNVVISSTPATDIVINSTVGSVLQFLNAGKLDLNGKALTLNNPGGSILINGTTRSITSAVPGGTVNITGSKSVSGTSPNSLIIDNNVTLSLSAPFDFGSGLTTINGTLLLNDGYTVTNAPAYGPSSLLKYYCGGVPPRGAEWSAASGYGFPNDVQIGFATTLDPGGLSLTGTALSIARDLIIDENSSIYLDYSGHHMTVPMKVGRNISISGNLSLSGVIGGDLEIGGDWTRTGSFFPNSRLVTFNGPAKQSLTGNVNFAYLQINNAAGVMFNGAANDTVLNNLILTDGKIDLGASNLTIAGTIGGNSGIASMILTSGTGEVRKLFTSVPASFTFPVGTDTTYSPVMLTLTSGSLDSAYIGVRVVAAKSPNDASASNYLNRTWTLSAKGISNPVYSDTLVYVPKDIVGSESRLTGKFFTNSVWQNIGQVDATNHYIAGNGLTAFGDFTAGEAITSTKLAISISAIPEGYYSVASGKLSLRDTLKAYLMNISVPFARMDSSLLIIDPDTFTGTATFSHATAGTYYLCVGGRAIIQTWSASGLVFTAGVTGTYNFTSSASQAYGNNLVHKGNKWCLYSGDVDQSGFIDNNDLRLIDNDAFNFVGSYAVTDLDGSLFVDNNDLLICDNNAFNFVGAATPKADRIHVVKPLIRQSAQIGN